MYSNIHASLQPWFFAGHEWPLNPWHALSLQRSGEFLRPLIHAQVDPHPSMLGVAVLDDLPRKIVEELKNESMSYEK